MKLQSKCREGQAGAIWGEFLERSPDNKAGICAFRGGALGNRLNGLWHCILAVLFSGRTLYLTDTNIAVSKHYQFARKIYKLRPAGVNLTYPLVDFQDFVDCGFHGSSLSLGKDLSSCSQDILRIGGLNVNPLSTQSLHAWLDTYTSGAYKNLRELIECGLFELVRPDLEVQELLLPYLRASQGTFNESESAITIGIHIRTSDIPMLETVGADVNAVNTRQDELRRSKIAAAQTLTTAQSVTNLAVRKLASVPVSTTHTPDKRLFADDDIDDYAVLVDNRQRTNATDQPIFSETYNALELQRELHLAAVQRPGCFSVEHTLTCLKGFAKSLNERYNFANVTFLFGADNPDIINGADKLAADGNLHGVQVRYIPGDHIHTGLSTVNYAPDIDEDMVYQAKRKAVADMFLLSYTDFFLSNCVDVANEKNPGNSFASHILALRGDVKTFSDLHSMCTDDGGKFTVIPKKLDEFLTTAYRLQPNFLIPAGIMEFDR